MGVATAAAVVGATVAVGSAVDQRNQQKKAAKAAEQASLQGAQAVSRASREGEKDILRANREAAQAFGRGSARAEEAILPFLDSGTLAFKKARSNIIEGREPVDSAFAQSIRDAGKDAVNRRVFDISGPDNALRDEVNRQTRISASGVAPQLNQALLEAGQGGISAAGDIGGIRQRGFEGLADIAGGTGAQRASVLVGQTGQLSQLASGAQDARLLSDVAGQQAKTTGVETLAKLAGQLSNG